MKIPKKTKYKSIHFVYDKYGKAFGGGLGFWQCVQNHHYRIGMVKRKGRQKRWAFIPLGQVALTRNYRRDIADFMSQLEKPK